MEPDFWFERWQEGRIGFHQSDINRHLVRFVDAMPRGPAGRVLVPLAGKTRDMAWLAERGYEVVGVELVEMALEAFFEENGLEHRRDTEEGVPIYEGGGVRAYAADIFHVSPKRVGPVDWIFDRAALVAMPASTRAEYAPHLLDFLSPGGEILLVTFEYDQSCMNGPPFSVMEDEVRRLFEPKADVERLEEESILDDAPRFRARGLDWMREKVYRVKKRG